MLDGILLVDILPGRTLLAGKLSVCICEILLDEMLVKLVILLMSWMLKLGILVDWMLLDGILKEKSFSFWVLFASIENQLSILGSSIVPISGKYCGEGKGDGEVESG